MPSSYYNKSEDAALRNHSRNYAKKHSKEVGLQDGQRMIMFWLNLKPTNVFSLDKLKNLVCLLVQLCCQSVNVISSSISEPNFTRGPQAYDMSMSAVCKRENRCTFSEAGTSIFIFYFIDHE